MTTTRYCPGTITPLEARELAPESELRRHPWYRKMMKQASPPAWYRRYLARKAEEDKSVKA